METVDFVDTEYILGDILEVPVLAGAQIVGGTMVAFDKERGGCTAVVGRRGYQFVGVALQGVDNSQGSTGQKMVFVRRRGRFLFMFSVAPTTKNLFCRVYGSTDKMVETDELGPEGPWVGNLVALEKRNSLRGWIEIDGAITEGRRG